MEKNQGHCKSVITMIRTFTNNRMLYCNCWKLMTFTCMSRRKWQLRKLIMLILSFQMMGSSLLCSVKDLIFCKFTKRHQMILKIFLNLFKKTSPSNNSKSLSNLKDVNTWNLTEKIQNTWQFLEMTSLISFHWKTQVKILAM